MSRDTSLPLRRAILTLLKADAGITALVPPERIYPPQVPALPAWPFARYGATQQLPLRAAGLDGSTITGTVHAFAKGPGEDAAARIGAAIAKALDGADGFGAVLVLEVGAGKAHVQHSGNTMLEDPAEANAWHCVVAFTARVLS